MNNQQQAKKKTSTGRWLRKILVKGVILSGIALVLMVAYFVFFIVHSLIDTYN